MISRTLLFFSFTTILLFTACRKTYIRKHFTGNFRFTDQYSWSDINGNHGDTTYVYDGEIKLSDKQEIDGDDKDKSTVAVEIIYYSNSDLREEVGKNGAFVPRAYHYGNFSGAFSDEDHLEFTYTDGSLGLHITNHVTGVRR